MTNNFAFNCFYLNLGGISQHYTIQEARNRNRLTLFPESGLTFYFQNLGKKTQVTGDCSVIEITQKTKLQTSHSLFIIATQVLMFCTKKVVSTTALYSGSEEILTLPSCKAVLNLKDKMARS